MSILYGLLILTLQFRPFPSEIPLAPYSVKLYCRMGASGTTESRVISVCPTSSTSCGYFEFSSSSTPNPIGVYECVDSSVLVTENDDHEKEKEDLFKRYCDDRSRCRVLSTDMLNDQFLRYLLETRKIHVEQSQETGVKFCCAINDALLDKVIRSGLNVLPTLSTKQISCNGEICNTGAVGCLAYSKEIEQAYVDEIILVRPAQLEYDEDNEQLNEQSFEEQYIGVEYSNEYHCVHRHFNDELYRYCLLVYNEHLPGRCYEGNGYRVCCCFVPSGKSTCDPLRKSVTATVLPPKTTSSAVVYAFALSVTAVYTSTMPTTKMDIQFTTTPSAPVNGANTNTSILVYNLSNEEKAENAPTSSEAHLHTTSTSETNVSGETGTNDSEDSLQDTTTPISTASILQQNILNHNSLLSEFPLESAAMSSTAAVAFETMTTTSKSQTTTASFNIFKPTTMRTRCRTIIEERSSLSVKKGSSKRVICESESFNSTVSCKQHHKVVAIVLLFSVLKTLINI